MDNFKSGLTRNNREKNRLVIPSRRTLNYSPLGEESALTLFQGYFNNKMTVMLLRLQKRNPEPDSLLSMKAVLFLDDLYRHMLKSDLQHDYKWVFIWLKKFFSQYPYVTPTQRRKAYEYIKLIYRLFGLELKLELVL